MSDEGRDRGAVFNQLIERQKEYVEELIEENRLLRRQVALLGQGVSAEADRMDSKAELADVCQERDGLKRELAELKMRLESVERENTEFASRYIQVERESSNLASLYVASYQLHSSLDYDVVIRRISEILINLIGAERFGIYVFDPRSNAFTLVGGEGVEDRTGGKVPLADNFLSRVARSGELYLATDVTTPGDDNRPIAALPLVASDELLGMLVIYKLLIQKDGFEPIDMELFDLLAGHAATALRAAQLYARSQRRASTLEGFLQILKDSPVEESPEES
jgi:nitrate/nitrite-specific signal transduction histidine kinase